MTATNAMERYEERWSNENSEYRRCVQWQCQRLEFQNFHFCLKRDMATYNSFQLNQFAVRTIFDGIFHDIAMRFLMSCGIRFMPPVFTVLSYIVFTSFFLGRFILITSFRNGVDVGFALFYAHGVD